MNKIINQIKQRAIELAKELELEIIDVEWVNEFGTNILRVIADSKDSLNIDQATALNEAISLELDKLDLIEDEYMLEVSSPGIERELKTEEDIMNNINNYVHIDFLTHFSITQKTKVLDIEGYLRNYSNNVFEIEYNNRGQIKKLQIDKVKPQMIPTILSLNITLNASLNSTSSKLNARITVTLA